MLIFKAKDEILYIPKLKSKAEEVFQCVLGFGGFFVCLLFCYRCLLLQVPKFQG